MNTSTNTFVNFFEEKQSDQFPWNSVIRNQKELFSFSSEGLLYGFILKENVFRADHDYFRSKFLELFKIGLLKRRSLIKDSIELSETFKKYDINHVFLKGIGLYFHNPSLFSSRLFRDIDILVDKKQISDSYKIVKDLGYSYFDKYVNDNAFDLKIRHHLPVLHKKNNTLLEIHSRITKKEDYENCPLTKTSLARKISDHDSGIFIQNINNLFDHIFYHGMKNKNTGNRIQMMLDISLIVKNYDIERSNFVDDMITNLTFEEIIADINQNYESSIYKYLQEEKINFPNYFYKKLAFNFRTIEDRYQVKRFTKHYFFSLFIEILRKLGFIKK